MWSGWINKLVYCFEKKIQTYLLFCPHYVLNHSDLQNQLVIVTDMLVVNGQFFFVKSTRLHMPTAKKTKIFNKEFWENPTPSRKFPHG